MKREKAKGEEKGKEKRERERERETKRKIHSHTKKGTNDEATASKTAPNARLDPRRKPYYLSLQ